MKDFCAPMFDELTVLICEQGRKGDPGDRGLLGVKGARVKYFTE